MNQYNANCRFPFNGRTPQDPRPLQSVNYSPYPSNEMSFQDNSGLGFRQPVQRFSGDHNQNERLVNQQDWPNGTIMQQEYLQQSPMFGRNNGNFIDRRFSNKVEYPGRYSQHLQQSDLQKEQISHPNYQFDGPNNSLIQSNANYLDSPMTSNQHPIQYQRNYNNNAMSVNDNNDSNSFHPGQMFPSVSAKYDETPVQYQSDHIPRETFLSLETNQIKQFQNPKRPSQSNECENVRVRHPIFNQGQTSNVQPPKVQIQPKTINSIVPQKQTNAMNTKATNITYKPKLLSLNQSAPPKPKEQKVEMFAKLSSSLESFGTHIFSIPLNKIVQTSNRLPRRLLANFETIGLLSEQVVPFGRVPGFRFNLVDGQHVQTCIFFDMDDVNPQLTPGAFYRCVGRYQQRHGLFQCFVLSECNEEDKKMLKIFEMHSEKQLATLIRQSSIKEK